MVVGMKLSVSFCVSIQSLKEELEGVKTQMKTEEKRASSLAEKVSELEVSDPYHT